MQKKRSKLRCPKAPQYLIISHKSRKKRYWDLLIVALAVYNSFLIPIDFSFYFYWRSEKTAVIIDLIIDCVFLIDVIIGFLTTYLDRNGKEEFD